jgi:hypothetical protein
MADATAETNMTRRAALGTVEWFKRERLHLIELAKAIDSFAAAHRSFQKLIDLGPKSDPDVSAALHTSGVIHYARPFVNNIRADGTRGAFQKKLVKRHANYVEGIHAELIDLRQKLVAHSVIGHVRLRACGHAEELFVAVLARRVTREPPALLRLRPGPAAGSGGVWQHGSPRRPLLFQKSVVCRS